MFELFAEFGWGNAFAVLIAVVLIVSAIVLYRKHTA